MPTNKEPQALSQYGGLQYFTETTSFRGSVFSDPSIHLPTHGSVHNSFNGTIPWTNHGSVKTSTNGPMSGSTRSNPFINNPFFEHFTYGGSNGGSLVKQYGQTWSPGRPRRPEYSSYKWFYPARRNIRDGRYRSVNQSTLSSGDIFADSCNLMSVWKWNWFVSWDIG